MVVASLIVGIVAALAAVAAVIAAVWGVRVGLRTERGDRKYRTRGQLLEAFELADSIRQFAGPGFVHQFGAGEFHPARQDVLSRALAGIEIPLPKCNELTTARDPIEAQKLAGEALAEIEQALAKLGVMPA